LEQSINEGDTVEIGWDADDQQFTFRPVRAATATA
jgi:hypothetical protein